MIKAEESNVVCSSGKNIVEMKSISKQFSGIPVLKNVNLSIRKGEVVALMGENGAGKSTLMKILCGVHAPDSGEIFIEGESVKIINPRKAFDLGVQIVHQELSLVNNLTIAQNIFLGKEPSKAGFVDFKKMIKDAQDILDSREIHLNPIEKVENLSIANKQLVEIVKATYGKTKILIMDEPTSALSKNEIQRLFEIINSLKSQGVSIVYISHKLDEIMEVCDRIVVLKDGCNSGESLIKDVTEDKIVTMMVGREVKYVYSKQIEDNAPEVLTIKNLSNDRVNNINFTLKQGEILGIAGLMGSGRTELLETIFGKRKAESGSIYVKGKKIINDTPARAIKNKFAFVTEDRKGNGLVLTSSVKRNNSLVNLKDYSSIGLINDVKRTEDAKESVQQFNIKTSSVEEMVVNLSGGNQQKVVLSKWIKMKPNFLLIDEPTRGIDVGAKAEIYQLLKQFVSEGLSIIMVSSELPEILALSDRVLVMKDGEIQTILDREKASEESIMSYATLGG